MIIRPLAFLDLPRVLGIERSSFPTPWSAAMFVLELGRSGSVCLAAEDGGRLVGYVICSKHDLDWHLMNIAVPISERGRGIATRLVSELINEIGDDARITLEVRPSNTPAIRLYEGLGFLAAGHRRAYYADTGEDAVIMWRTPSTLVGRLDDVPNAEVQER